MTPPRERINGPGAATAASPSQIRVALVALGVAALLAVPAVALPPPAVFAVLSVGLVVTAVYVYPPLAAYLLLVATPLLAGVDRGTAIPVLRPHEALAVILACGLLLRGAVQLVTVGVRRPRVRGVDTTIVLMGITSSVVPLLWMLARGREITSDDLQFALAIWKYYGIYLIFRASVRTVPQVRRCLWLAMGAASVVAVVAMAQALHVPGVQAFLIRFFSGEEGTADIRAGSTLGQPFALADLMAFNLAIAVGLWRRERRMILPVLGGLFVFGMIATAQFSAAIALLVTVLVLGLIGGRQWRFAAALLPLGLLAGVLMKPVVEQRLMGFSSPAGLPQSWLFRLRNLRTYFWPELTSDYNFLFGVRPAARVRDTSIEGGFVWIESGHTWLLWVGGIPFFVAFFLFLWVSVRTTLRIARARVDAVGAAATASSASLLVVAVLMLLDQHLTLRGSADLLFALLALSSVPHRRLRPAGRAPVRTPEAASR